MSFLFFIRICLLRLDEEAERERERELWDLSVNLIYDPDD